VDDPGRRWGTDRGDVSLSAVLTAAALTAVLATVGMFVVVLAGKQVRSQVEQSRAQTQLVDTVNRVVADVAYSQSVMVAEPDRLIVQINGGEHCQWIQWERTDTGLMHTGVQWAKDECPGWDGQSLRAGEPPHSGEDISRGVAVDGQVSNVFEYFTKDDQPLVVPVEDPQRVGRVRIRAARPVEGRNTDAELITSAVPRQNQAPASSRMEVPDLIKPVLTAALAPNKEDAHLSWTRVEGATYYLVQHSPGYERMQPGPDSLTQLVRVPADQLAFPLVADAGYFTGPVDESWYRERWYRVIAVNETTGQWAPSNQARVPRPHEYPPVVSSSVCVENPITGATITRVSVTWPEIPGAVGYRIRRSTGGGEYDAANAGIVPATVNPVEVNGRRGFTTTVDQPGVQVGWYQVEAIAPGTAGSLPVGDPVRQVACPGIDAGCSQQSDTATDSQRVMMISASGDERAPIGEQVQWNLYRAAAAGSRIPVGDPVHSGASGVNRDYVFSQARGSSTYWVVVGSPPGPVPQLRVPVTCVSRPANPTVSVSLMDARGVDSANAPGAGVPDAATVNRVVVRFPRVAGALRYRIFLQWQTPTSATDWSDWSQWRDMGEFADNTWSGSTVFDNWTGAVPAWATRFQVVAYAVNDSTDTNEEENASTTLPNGCPNRCPAEGSKQAGWSGPADPGTRRLHPAPPGLSVSRYSLSDTGMDVRENAVLRVSGRAGQTAGASDTHVWRSDGVMFTPANRVYDRGLGYGWNVGYDAVNLCTGDPECVPWADRSTNTPQWIKTGPGAVPGTITTDASHPNCQGSLFVQWNAAPGADNYHVFTDAGLVQAWLGRTWTCVPFAGGSLNGNRGGSDTIFVVPNNSATQGVPSAVTTRTNPHTNPSTGAAAKHRFRANGKDEWIWSWVVKSSLAACMDLALPGPPDNDNTYADWNDRPASADIKKWNEKNNNWAEAFSYGELANLGSLYGRFGETNNWAEQVAMDAAGRIWSKADNDNKTSNKMEARAKAAGSTYDQNLVTSITNQANNQTLPWRATTPNPGGSVLDRAETKTIRLDASAAGLGQYQTRVPAGRTTWVVASNSTTGGGAIGVDGAGNINVGVAPADESTPVRVWVFAVGAPWGGAPLVDAGRIPYIQMSSSSTPRIQRYMKRGLLSVVRAEAYADRPRNG